MIQQFDDINKIIRDALIFISEQKLKYASYEIVKFKAVQLYKFAIFGL